MTLRELKEEIDLYVKALPDYNDPTVCIPISDGTVIGGHPVIEVRSVCPGFDWDSGKFFIYPEKALKLKNNKKNK